MNRTGAWLLAAAVGVALGGATVAWLAADAVLAACSALFWTVGVGLTLASHPELLWSSNDGERSPNGPEERRWTGATGGLVTLAATAGVSPTLPMSNELRLALGLFVIGVALTMVNVGYGLALATVDGDAAESAGDDPAASD